MAAKKILIADDDEGILGLLRFILEDEGYEVETHFNGATIRSMETDFPDLILLDIHMNSLDGREICQQLKRQPHTRHIPVIMISAFNNLEKIIYDTGADAFIGKPFDRQALLDKINILLTGAPDMPKN